MASEGSVLRHIVRQRTLDEANCIYPNSTGESTTNGVLTPTGKPYPFFVPRTSKGTLGSPTALAIGAFSTTLTTLSFALREWRGFFYGGFVEYNNALGFFVLMWTVLNTFFLLGSLPIYFVYIGILFFVELAFGFATASYFATADGSADAALALKKAGGAFAFVAGMLGYYTVAHLMCQIACQFIFPMGDTSRFFVGKKDPVKGVQGIENAEGLGTKGDQ
ncbi:hypothetical protein BKA65DRAFT_557294 [Rhexocercosporidium sp. MPI-PUGE-AT-0058]|nr:hypothetical protein BKA65DRAFT_557294 [Rhexocercosporidium sp. MPI-PUGE-AT-0058]